MNSIKSKTKLAFFLCLSGLELFFHQNIAFAGREDLPLENLSMIKTLSLKVDKAKCQLGLNENEINSSVYSYLRDSNIPVDTAQPSNHILNISIACKSNELISIFSIDVQVNQFINLDGINTKVITYDDGIYGTVETRPFSQVEKENIAELIQQFVSDYNSVK